jgi:hypothetical protein
MKMLLSKRESKLLARNLKSLQIGAALGGTERSD